MNELTIAAILDTLLSLSEIFEFDSKLLLQQRQCLKLERDIKKEMCYPKARFFDFMTRELERQIEQKCGPLKNLQKNHSQQQQSIDAIMYKLKLIDQTMINQQNGINEKPTRKDLFEVNELANATQRQLNIFTEKIENSNEYFRLEVQSKLNDILYKDDFILELQDFKSEISVKYNEQFALKVETKEQLEEVRQKNKQLQQLIQTYYKETNKQFPPIQDHIQKVEQQIKNKLEDAEFHEFYTLVFEQFTKKKEFNEYMGNIEPILVQIQQKNTEFNQKIEDFHKFIKQTDYQILSKASKMDHELLKKELKNNNNFINSIQLEINKIVNNFDSIILKVDQKIQTEMDQLQQQIEQKQQDVIVTEINNQMMKFDLNEIETKIVGMKQLIATKANKVDVIDILKTKSTKTEVENMKAIIACLDSLQQGVIKNISEFMELFSGVQDLESFNFKKQTIQKLITDTNSLIQNSGSIRRRSESVKEEQLKIMKQIQSPRIYKPLLRPLLTTTYTVTNKKSQKLNNSNS